MLENVDNKTKKPIWPSNSNTQLKIQSRPRNGNDQYLEIFFTEEYIALSLSKVSMVENIRLGIEDLQIIRHKATIV